MRRFSVVLIALGTFLIVLAPLARFYAYPRLAVAPVNQRSVTTLVGPGATIFDISTLKEIQTDLTTKVRTVGDANAAKKAPKNTVVWVSSSSTKSSDGVVRSSDVEREAFDQHTGEAVNCCGEFISETQGEQTAIKHKGLLVKFPFATEKKTYAFWDGTLKKAVPIKYVGSSKIKGLTVYEFTQTIPPTKTESTDVPANLVGGTGTANVSADRMYSNVRTLWVEPNTGVIIKRTEQQNSTLNYNGSPQLTITKVNTGYDDKTISGNVDKYGTQGKLLHLLRSVVPIGALVLGLVLLVAGLVLNRRSQTA